MVTLYYSLQQYTVPVIHTDFRVFHRFWKRITSGKQLVTFASMPYSYKCPVPLSYPSNAVWDSWENHCTIVHYGETILLTWIGEGERGGQCAPGCSQGRARCRGSRFHQAGVFGSSVFLCFFHRRNHSVVWSGFYVKSYFHFLKFFFFNWVQ